MSKAAAAAAAGAAGLGLSMAGSASASTLPAADTPADPASQRFVLGEEEMADVGLATFHLFDREEGIAGMTQVAWRGCRCGGCRGCRGCRARACRCGGGCGGCCARWGRCRWC